MLLLGMLLLQAAACGRRPVAEPPAAGAARGALPAAKEVEIQEDPVKTGIEAGDAGLAAKVRLRLGGDPQLAHLSIEVDAEGGRVTLWGHVSRLEDRAAAEQLARRTPGVAAVNDLIRVDGEDRPAPP
jgi:osmotically-inducible protein OsmY